MGLLWTLLTHAHTLAGAVLMLIYPLYATVRTLKSPFQTDNEQWLTYWILFSFLTHVGMHLQPPLEWTPIWYHAKLILVAWLVLPQFRGAAFLYSRFVREHILKRHAKSSISTSTSSRGGISMFRKKTSTSSRSGESNKSKKKGFNLPLLIPVYIKHLHLHLSLFPQK